MKSFLWQLNSHPSYSKMYELGKLIAITGSAQLLIQLLGFVSGILVIRLLPTSQYAYYTLANSMLGVMTVLADGGITNGVLAQGGKVWLDRQKLGLVLSTGFELRKKFTLISFFIVMPVLFYLLHHHGAPWQISLLILLSIIPSFYTILIGNLLEVILKLRQDVVSLQKIQIGATIGRLLLLSITLFTFPWAIVAVLAAGFPQIWANFRIQRTVKVYADLSLETDPKIKKEILSFSKRVLPGAVYYCLSGQITFWLLSIFGSTEAVAQMGALSRLTMVLNLFSVLFTTLILPRFARLPLNASLLLNRFFQITGLILFICISLVFLVWIFPNQLLWLLGDEYTQLRNEVVLSAAVSCVGLTAGMCHGLFTSRGWAINPAISIPINIGSILLGALLFQYSTLVGVLFFNLFIVAIQFLMNGFYCFIKIIRSNSVPATEF